ncbi:PREDICTED: uncharacterized protein LOC108371776 [Rhagoletis zephyria]|uniref:uncharacterized protein LOC108371776 n=1 Tax=Rhagoletis zephyria TaxID=28612 RepID=UPI000811A925|nr:PREDICTED: uncharacterized protein LOC108371776 [Rhagoletis zephyria]
MVVFTCNQCGDSLKKNKVEPHLRQCRTRSLSCVDCLTDFDTQSYNKHYECISEDQKYGGQNYQQPEFKGKAKQNDWVQKIKSLISENQYPREIQNILNSLVSYDNIPRKKPKFANFVKNSFPLATSQAGAKFVDTNKTFYSNAEWCNSGGFLAKFVRIAIAKTTEGSGSSAPSPLLNCKIFVPVKKNGSEPSSPDHEMQTLKDAVQSWFAKTEAKVLSVETETISSAITWTSSTTLIDTCLSLNKFPCDQLIVFKVYIDGHYVEPSKEPKHAKASN